MTKKTLNKNERMCLAKSSLASRQRRICEIKHWPEQLEPEVPTAQNQSYPQLPESGAGSLRGKCQMWKILNPSNWRRSIAVTQLRGELCLQTQGREGVLGFLSLRAWAGLKSHPSWSKARGFAGEVTQRMRS